MNRIVPLSRPWDRNFKLWRQELVDMVRLAVPLVLNKLSFMAILTTDMLMMGWLGPEALAAGSLSGHFFGFVILFSIGMLSALAPIFAHHLGARHFRNVRRTFRQGFWLATMISVPSLILIWHGGSILVLLGQDAELAAASQAYLRFLALGFLPGLWRLVISFLLASHSRPRANLMVTLVGIGLNFLANYALMFGNFGFPKLGLVGAGIASAIVMTAMFLFMLIFVLTDRRLSRYRLLGRFWRSDWSQLSEIFRLGFPIAVTELCEMSLFFAAILLMGLLGTDALSAHAIAIQSCAVVVMVAVGISQAATVRVGYAMGAGNIPAAIRAGWTALSIGIGFSLIPATVFWIFGSTIIGIYLDTSQPQNMGTSNLALSLLAVGAFFQVVDFAQVIARGILQGMKDTRWPMIIAIGSYWGIGIPLMALFSLHLGYGGQSIWIALVIALSVVAVLLIHRVKEQFKNLQL